MRKHSSIDQLAAITVRAAQSENAAMQRDLRALRDNVSGLNRALRALNPISRPHTKRTTSGPSLLGEFGTILASNLVNGNLGNGYVSLTQTQGNNLAQLALGHRIR